jgi:hypothetical protein
MIHHDSLSDITFDIVRYGRYHQKTTSQFSIISSARNRSERDAIAMQYGI